MGRIGPGIRRTHYLTVHVLLFSLITSGFSHLILIHACLIPLATRHCRLPITQPKKLVTQSFKVSENGKPLLNFINMEFLIHDGIESPLDEKQHNIA